MVNIRVLPRVCDKCKDFIFTPKSEQIIDYDRKKSDLIEVCRKCKDNK